MAIQRYAADSGYIVVSDRRHGGAEQPKTPRKARRALAAATQSASPQPFFDALPQPSIGAAVSPCTLTCNLAMRWGVSTVRAVPAHAHDGSRSACGKLSVNMVNAKRGMIFGPRGRGGTSTEILMFPTTCISHRGVIARPIASLVPSSSRARASSSARLHLKPVAL
jgi:hypothetical protein